LLVAVLLTAGCGRIDTLRLAHANGGTPVEWPSGATSVVVELDVAADGRPWLPVAVDDNPPVPFLLQASAGAIALTGARAAGFGPFGAGSLTLRHDLLPGIDGGMLIKQRRLALGALALGDQSVLLVDTARWPHDRPRGGPAGVIGHDLFRRFVVELDIDAGRLALYRPGSLDVTRMSDSQRLAVLDRIPYFEAWLDAGGEAGRWVRLQFEPAAPVGICLDEEPRRGLITIAGRPIQVADAPCPQAGSPRRQAARDGIFGAGALPEMVVAVDYEGGRIGFAARD
jgi:hypothetical protein